MIGFKWSLKVEVHKAFSSFWEKHPALFLGLAFLLGAATALSFHWLFILFFAFFSCFASRKQLIIALLCFAGIFSIATWHTSKPTPSAESLSGTGIFHIEQVSIRSSFFQRSILYKGTLVQFDAVTGEHYTDLPCHIYLPYFGQRPPADTDYAITGRLLKKSGRYFQLKPDKNKPWQSLPRLMQWSEWRFQMKQHVIRYLKTEISDVNVRSFLAALLTGEIDERVLSMEFGKIGLQHILAISGFHFAMIALFLNFLFRLLFPYRFSLILLICSLTGYFFFLGNAPSIQRAYIAIVLFACGQLFRRRTSGLNALGAGLSLEILLDPFVVTQLSFQLSFLCTLAILLLYPVFHRAMNYLFPERSAEQTSSMSRLDKHGYLLSSFFRKTLALNGAVLFAALPVLLHLFHKFPLLSIAYNLFFPACVALSMLLLLTSLFFAPLLPALSHLVHQLNQHWTSAILTLTSHPPACLDFALRIKTFPFALVICCLALSFFIGVMFHEQNRLQKMLA
jgi:competence protein ComEC